LPEALRDRPITRVGVGQSGAGVYAVGDHHILKVSPTLNLDVVRAAAAAGVAPALVHVDEARGAIVMERVADPFPPLMMRDPQRAISMLGQTLRHVHDLPVPAGEAADPRGLLASLKLPVLPPWARTTIDRMLELRPPPRGALVFSHNDANPSNLAVSGDRVVLLDWDTAGPNDATWDLATVAMFLRLDDGACTALCRAHGGVAVDDRFVYERRLVAALCGALFITLAKQTFEDRGLSMAECHQQMRAGTLALATPEGRWAFGLALVKTAAADLDS
jgi:aminoglycoside phosphotransferase